MIEGIRELNQHVIFRDSSAELLGPFLLEASPAVFGAAVGLVVQLDSPRATTQLVDCLDSVDEYKRVGAWQALRRLTEIDLPRERNAWQDRLGI